MLSPLKSALDFAVQPLLTDLYQVTMCYAYWKSNLHQQDAVFDLFFRKSPFNGEYAVFTGLDDCLQFIRDFRFSDSDLAYLRQVLPPSTEFDFFDYLASLTCDQINLSAIPEGSVVFPTIPLVTVRGPMAVCQLIETTLLNLINYSSLITTNATRFRQAAGPDCRLLEFGLRRAQGPNGALSASKYCYIGGFDSTSNLLAGKEFGIPVSGTQAHSFVSSFSSCEDLPLIAMHHVDGTEGREFFRKATKYLQRIVNFTMSHFYFECCDVVKSETSQGELAAFCAYAIAFPDNFLVLVDTYDVLEYGLNQSCYISFLINFLLLALPHALPYCFMSGVANFLAVVLVLNDLGHRAKGIRIDSGDLAYLSREARRIFAMSAKCFSLDWLERLTIVASNDINEETIISMNEQGHEIDAFGVGTHLVTCQKQPALGCVYKLVSLANEPKMKLSQEMGKITIGGKKKCYRLYGQSGHLILDLMMLENEPAPQPKQRILTSKEIKRAVVIPTKVEELHVQFWTNGKVVQTLPTLEQVRTRVRKSLHSLRQDHKRCLNPTPYKVSNTLRKGTLFFWLFVNLFFSLLLIFSCAS